MLFRSGFPVLAVTDMPPGWQLSHVRLMTAGMPYSPPGSAGTSSKHVRLVYDCRRGTRFGSITITERPAGEDDAISMSSLLRQAMATGARATTVSGHAAELYSAASLGNLLAWDADATRVELGWALLPDEIARQVAEGLR